MPILSYEELLVPPPRSELAAYLDMARCEWLADHRTAQTCGENA
ncbi:hypothetical protein [Microbispora sp. CA-102843]